MTEQLGFNGFIARHMAAGLDRVFEVLHMDGWLDAELGCEGETHSVPRYGHNPAEGASYRVIVPCGHNWIACASWVAASDQYEGYECNRGGCEARFVRDMIQVVPFG